MLKLSVLISALLFPCAAFSGPNDEWPLPGEHKLKMSGRVDVPYPSLPRYNEDLTQSGTNPSQFPVQMSRHHIIPLGSLRAFFNTVAIRGHFNRLSGFFRVFSDNICPYAERALVDIQRDGPDLQNAANVGLAIESRWINHADNARPPEGIDTLHQYFAWMPGNLMIGPNQRNDDPGALFEENSNAIIGQEAYDISLRVYSNMNRYVNDDDSSLLQVINGDLMSIARVTDIYALRADDWVRDADGKYSIKPSRESRTMAAHSNQPRPKSTSSTCKNFSPNFEQLQGRMLSIYNTTIKDEL